MTSKELLKLRDSILNLKRLSKDPDISRAQSFKLHLLKEELESKLSFYTNFNKAVEKVNHVVR